MATTTKAVKPLTKEEAAAFAKKAIEAQVKKTGQSAKEVTDRFVVTAVRRRAAVSKWNETHPKAAKKSAKKSKK